jgi:hypothetical protein
MEWVSTGYKGSSTVNCASVSGCQRTREAHPLVLCLFLSQCDNCLNSVPPSLTSQLPTKIQIAIVMST